MLLRILFNNDSQFSPVVQVVSSNGIFIFTKAPWVQVLALLAYRRIVDINYGHLNCEDLKNLIAFHNKTPRDFCKFLRSQIDRFPMPEGKHILKEIIYTKADGTVFLIIHAVDIETDFDHLSRYIKWIYCAPLPEHVDPVSLLDLVKKEINQYHLSSAHDHLKSYLQHLKGDARTDYDQLILTYMLFSEVEHNLNINGTQPNWALKEALNITNRIRGNSQKKWERARILSYIAMQSDLNVVDPMTVYSLNTEIINLAPKDYKNSADWLPILAHCYHHRAYLEKRYDLPVSDSRDLYTSIDLYNRLFELVDPARFTIEHGVQYGIKLLDTMIVQQKQKQPVHQDIISECKNARASQLISPFISLLLNEWIVYNQLRYGTLESASDLLCEALLKHPETHETSAYTRMSELYNKLKS